MDESRRPPRCNLRHRETREDCASRKIRDVRSLSILTPLLRTWWTGQDSASGALSVAGLGWGPLHPELQSRLESVDEMGRLLDLHVLAATAQQLQEWTAELEA